MGWWGWLHRVCDVCVEWVTVCLGRSDTVTFYSQTLILLWKSHCYKISVGCCTNHHSADLVVCTLKIMRILTIFVPAGRSFQEGLQQVWAMAAVWMGGSLLSGEQYHYVLLTYSHHIVKIALLHCLSWLLHQTATARILWFVPFRLWASSPYPSPQLSLSNKGNCRSEPWLRLNNIIIMVIKTDTVTTTKTEMTTDTMNSNIAAIKRTTHFHRISRWMLDKKMRTLFSANSFHWKSWHHCYRWYELAKSKIVDIVTWNDHRQSNHLQSIIQQITTGSISIFATVWEFPRWSWLIICLWKHSL